jgi:outer membrane lipoprotein SlyB
MNCSRIAALVAIMALLAGCGKDMSSNTYTSSGTSGKVLKGTIISMRAVKIKEHDKLQDNTVGGLAGGALGAAGGSAVGNGSGSVAAAIGSAVVGAVAGAYLQDTLSTSDGVEYLVQLDNKNIKTVQPRTKKTIRESESSLVSDDMKGSISTETQTDIISVVQAADTTLAEGSAVYVVYSDDHPRLVSASKKSQ